MDFEMYDRSHRFNHVMQAVGGGPLRLAIALDKDIAGTSTGQLIALALCNIVPRISERYTTIDLLLPPQDVNIPRVKYSGALTDFLLRELNAICPWGQFRAVEHPVQRYDHCIVIGKEVPLSAAHVIYALASGWRCFVSEVAPFSRQSLSFNPAACLAAASLAAMFVYRRAERIDTLVPECEINGWSLLDYSIGLNDGPELPSCLDLGEVRQAGMGGTGNALLWVLRYGPDLHGRWIACEHEIADITNWNRYLLMKFDDARRGRHKTELALREFAGVHSGLDFRVIPSRVEPLYPQFDSANVVLATVDDPKIRVELQPHSRNTLLNVGTNSQYLSVSVHKTAKILSGGACVECLLGQTNQAERRQRESTVSFVLGLAGAVLGSEFLKHHALPDYSLSNSWLANVFHPAAARVSDRLAAPNCATCRSLLSFSQQRRAQDVFDRQIHALDIPSGGLSNSHTLDG